MINLGFGLKAEIVVTADAITDEIARHNREATKHKKTDIARSIFHLREAALLDFKYSKWSSTQTMLRLPVFMQLGGQFDECLVEFQKIKDRVPELIRNTMPSLSKLGFTAHCHHEISCVYDKMRLACKREKRKDLAADCIIRFEAHRDAWANMQDALEIERKQERFAYETRSYERKAERERLFRLYQ